MIKQVLWIYVLVGFVWEVDCPVGSELTILLGLGISGLGLLPAFSITVGELTETLFIIKVDGTTQFEKVVKQ